MDITWGKIMSPKYNTKSLCFQNEIIISRAILLPVLSSFPLSQIFQAWKNWTTVRSFQALYHLVDFCRMTPQWKALVWKIFRKPVSHQLCHNIQEYSMHRIKIQIPNDINIWQLCYSRPISNSFKLKTKINWKYFSYSFSYRFRINNSNCIGLFQI